MEIFLGESCHLGTVRNESWTCPWLRATIVDVLRRLRRTEVEEVIAIPEGMTGTAGRPVPDQFTFMFRVESRMTVIDRHHGHDGIVDYHTRSYFKDVIYVLMNFDINKRNIFFMLFHSIKYNIFNKEKFIYINCFFIFFVEIGEAWILKWLR